MRLIARSTLAAFWMRHPEAQAPLERWEKILKTANWNSTAEVQAAVPGAKVLNGERVRFAVCGGNYRLIVSFDFPRRAAFVKFVGTHAEYDRVDALSVSQF
jgi:mRNA interferase HigB